MTFTLNEAPMIPAWLHDLSVAYLALGFACAVLIGADELRHPQHMGIMNAVWPITAYECLSLSLMGVLRRSIRLAPPWSAIKSRQTKHLRHFRSWSGTGR